MPFSNNKLQKNLYDNDLSFSRWQVCNKIHINNITERRTKETTVEETRYPEETTDKVKAKTVMNRVSLGAEKKSHLQEGVLTCKTVPRGCSHSVLLHRRDEN